MFVIVIYSIIRCVQNSLTKFQPFAADSSGRSGAKFWWSYDWRYYLKTLLSEEVEQLHHILKQYHSVSGKISVIFLNISFFSSFSVIFFSNTIKGRRFRIRILKQRESAGNFQIIKNFDSDRGNKHK